MAGAHDDHLIIRLQEVCNSIALDADSWGPALCELAQRTSKRRGDHASFYLEFMEGIRDLLDNEEEDRILRRFLDQSLASESRIQADDKDIRDHLTHVTQVFLAGWIILNSCPVFTHSEMKPYGWAGGKDLLRNLNHCWLYAALLHDCAYSVEHAKRALKHELAVRNLFINVYRPGASGASDFDRIKDKAAKLWEKRAEWRGVDFRFHDLHQKQYARPDHGIVGAIALWDEDASEDLKKWILEPAALAIACHNFKYVVEEIPEDQQIEWLRLSLKKEPISVLLHICDELQEWGRERIDEAIIYKHLFKPLRYAATELTHLEVHDYSGLALNVRLQRRLYAEHRPIRHRIVREQERAIAKTARSFTKLFVTQAPDEKDFHVRLRVQQTVDDTRCKQELCVDWPLASHNVLQKLHDEWRQGYEVGLLLDDDAVYAEKDPTPWLSIRSNVGEIRMEDRTLLVVLGAGGAGKSTLLQRVARNHESKGPVLYVRQLPDTLTDIQNELREFCKRGKPALLIVDHLDRLVEDENAPFWVEQISSASKTKDLDLAVVLASRTEEYRRYFQGSLQGFKDLYWVDKKSPHLVPENVPDPADDDGRMRAHALESQCGMSYPQVSLLAKLALDMGQRRSLELPADVEKEKYGEFKDRVSKARGKNSDLIIFDQSRKAMFLHDCLQDLFSAVEIVSSLASDERASTTSDAISPGADIVIRQLERLPRDVPRLLFDLLASSETKLLIKETKDKSALRLASAFIEEPTIQQWLYDTGRLQQARHAIGEYLTRPGNGSAVELVARKFLGHVRYERFNIGKFDTYSEAEEAISQWIKSALAADRLLENEKNGSTRDRYRWFLAFLADHLFLVLTRYASRNQESLKLAQKLCEEAEAGSKKATVDDVFEPGWLSALLRAFSAAKGWSEIDELFKSIDKKLTEFRGTGNQIHWLDVRRAHLASHLGNYFLEKRQGEVAKEFFQRSISRRERVLREMEREPLNLRAVEVFATLCQGYADNAHQYRGIFECLFRSHEDSKKPDDLPNLAMELIQAHRLQETKWSQARLHRGPSERLPNMFRTSLPWLATGRVLTDLVESLRPNTIEEVRQKLAKEVAGLLNDYRQEGEVHERYAKGDSLGHSVFRNEPEQVKALREIANAAAEFFWQVKQT